MNRRKIIYNSLLILLLLMIFVFTAKLSESIRTDYLNGIALTTAINTAPQKMLSSPFKLAFHKVDLSIGALVVMLILMFAFSRKHSMRPGEEYGSARWGTKADIKPFIDPIPDHNIILTRTESLSLAPRMKVTATEDYNRNKNVLVMGGSGAGKTRYFVKPNLCQCYGSYVVNDTKGTLPSECGKMLKENGYKLRIFNIKDAEGMKHSMKYNPFKYIKDEADILEFVTALMANTTGEGAQKGEQFWQDAERLYYCALIGYMMTDEVDPEDRNMPTLLDIHRYSDAREDDEEYKCAVDLLFDELEEKDPDCYAIRQYRDYKKAAGKTAKGILISCSARLSVFNIKELRDLMTEDELQIDKICDRKTALFIIISDTQKTFHFIAGLLYTQLITQLVRKADNVYGGCFPMPVRLILDEFHTSRIPNFENAISTFRSRNISVNILLQSKSQLEGVYKDMTDTIIDNCDTTLFLGGKGNKTLKELSELLGKETISTINDSRSRGTQKNDSTNYQGLGRELMMVDELSGMSRSRCICMISGVRPFKSYKYNLKKHPRYKQLADYDKRNTYTPTIALPILEDERFEIVDIDIPEDSENVINIDF